MAVLAIVANHTGKTGRDIVVPLSQLEENVFYVEAVSVCHGDFLPNVKGHALLTEGALSTVG